jgi:hypothetical protein
MTCSTEQNQRGERSTDGAEARACRTVDASYAAWNAHDPAKILALTTADISYEDPMAPQSVLHGQAQVEGYLPTNAGSGAIPGWSTRSSARGPSRWEATDRSALIKWWLDNYPGPGSTLQQGPLAADQQLPLADLAQVLWDVRRAARTRTGRAL